MMHTSKKGALFLEVGDKMNCASKKSGFFLDITQLNKLYI